MTTTPLPYEEFEFLENKFAPFETDYITVEGGLFLRIIRSAMVFSNERDAALAERDGADKVIANLKRNSK